VEPGETRAKPKKVKKRNLQNYTKRSTTGEHNAAKQAK